MSLLEVKNLSHSYGDKVLYHDASSLSTPTESSPVT